MLRWAFPVLWVVLCLIPAPVSADSQYQSYATGDDSAVDIYGENWYAQSFTTNDAYYITSVRLKIYRVGNPGTLTVSIRAADVLGAPSGSDRTSGTINANTITTGTGGAWYEIEFSSQWPLQANTQYTIVVRAVAGDSSNYVCWRFDDGDATYANGTYVSSSNSGMGWATDTDSDFMFSTWGEVVMQILGAKVFRGYLEEGDWLVVVFYGNEYPPYYGTESPTDFFDLQLIEDSLEVITVLAQVKLQQWGVKPGAIYLSKAMADQLEWGNTNYQVRMYGRFGDNPYVSLPLTAARWSGSDLKVLDDLVLNAAEVMAVYYDTAMTTFVQGTQVLNSIGGTFFQVGIPRLGHVRPHLFEYPPMDIDYTPTQWTREYESSFHWQELLGPMIVADAQEVGAVFGLGGLDALRLAFFGLWIGISGVVAALAGSAALLVSIPFLIIGVVTGLLPIAAFAVVTALLVLVVIWIFWFRGT